MSKKKEGKIEQAVMDYAKDNGFLVRKYSSPGVPGGPDRILFGHGTIFLMEFKTHDGKLSAEQKNEITRLKNHGVKVFVIDDICAGKQVINGAVLVQRRLKHSGCW